MKYIMIETSEGARMPFLFPESCTHSVMAELMRTMLDWFHNMKATIVVSAGFVNMGTDLTVHGESESLGGLKSVKADAARIILGHAIQFMPDPMVTMLLGQLEGNVRSGVDSDLAIAIAEHAFNAGFDAGGFNVRGIDAQTALSEYTPPEELCGVSLLKE